MQIRQAQVADVPAIHELITEYAELDRMLFRSISDIFETLQCFLVADEDGRVLGCVALRVIWEDLGEIQSLAVARASAGKGVGRELVNGAVGRASRLGLKRLFTLTLEPGFFTKAGFGTIERKDLPMKVWSDCARCPKQDHCDEVAMIRNLT